MALAVVFVLLLFVAWLWNATRGPDEVKPGTLTEEQPGTPKN